ncbi:molybdopterin-guanine dinucleotide biosynthesis protein MobA [Pseudanabaena sp. lw0831]|uniref:molybdenum cofactor guanylyltransferase n=1 Tax=Pseudanabaena sp. lw0831 TaxID=1357935 RepID=UPI0019152AB7|nr:molybdenum cofactor guanylyltransferase [Pseudanabaena sp. lw0831]GBO53371.1 molybdopterin-guanine dinucleotide biosynthesis protein MobA [Pseudanabaena sp. lw0831]
MLGKTQKPKESCGAKRRNSLLVNIIAIALSGGKSSRMGRDKALLEINGETLLLKTCRTALQVSAAVYIVARSQEQYQEAISYNQPQFSVVIDQQFDGALVGFWQGIQAISSPVDWILLLACDLPNLQGDILQLWASQLANLSETAIAYLPRYVDERSQKQWEPLCGFYRWQCQDSLREFINNGGRSFQKWLSIQEVIEIENAPLAMLFNCNTPDDFRSIK